MTRPSSPSPPNPNRVRAGRLNHQKRRGLTAAGAARLRAAALANRPWEHATGPATPEGKARSAANGRYAQAGERSVRSLRVELAGIMALAGQMQATRARLAGGGPGGRTREP